MNKEKYWSRILKLALPIMINNVIAQIQMLIDKIFLGRLELTCTSAVGNATSPMWTTMSTIFSLTLGGTILISQAVGANDINRAKSIMASVFKYINVLSVFWFMIWMFGAPIIFRIMKVDVTVIDMSIQYARYYAPVFLITGITSSIGSLLQVSERTRILVVYGIIRSGLNILLDYCFIFGNLGFPRMEVAGAALATTIAEYVGIVFVMLYVIFNKKLIIKPSFNMILSAKWNLFWASVKVGIPAALEDFAWNLGNLFLIVMLNVVSPEAAGVYTIIFSVELLPVAVISALGQATVTLSGQEVGKKNYRGVRTIVKLSAIVCAALDTVILLCFIILPKEIMRAFTTDKTVIAAAVVYLLIVGIDLFPKAGNIVIGSGIRGYGDTKWMLKTQICGTIFVVAGSAILVLGFKMGMMALFWLVVADETLRCALNYSKLIRISK